MNVHRNMVLSLTLILALATMASAQSNPGDGKGMASAFESADTIFIVDQTGVKWDITHAVNVFGMLPENFNFGLGGYEFSPIMNPPIITVGDPEFPDGRHLFEVVGAMVNGRARAYGINDIVGREVVNDSIGGTHVAATY